MNNGTRLLHTVDEIVDGDSRVHFEGLEASLHRFQCVSMLVASIMCCRAGVATRIIQIVMAENHTSSVPAKEFNAKIAWGDASSSLAWTNACPKSSDPWASIWTRCCARCSSAESRHVQGDFFRVNMWFVAFLP